MGQLAERVTNVDAVSRPTGSPTERSATGPPREEEARRECEVSGAPARSIGLAGSDTAVSALALIWGPRSTCRGTSRRRSWGCPFLRSMECASSIARSSPSCVLAASHTLPSAGEGEDVEPCASTAAAVSAATSGGDAAADAALPGLLLLSHRREPMPLASAWPQRLRRASMMSARSCARNSTRSYESLSLQPSVRDRRREICLRSPR